jgi:excisionase family DNA binding protein
MEGCIDVNALSVATLRQLLSEAETRERQSLTRERAELERERAKMQSALGNGADPAVGLPVHLRSIARAMPPVLTARQVRNVLKVSAKTLRKWIEDGKLTASQHGDHGRLLITRDAVLQLLGSEDGQ